MVPSQTTGKICHCHALDKHSGCTLKPRGTDTLAYTPIHSYTHNLSFSLIDV